jgi:nucleoside-diphosphate kinase
VDLLCSDAVVAIELVGDDCVAAWQEAMGPADPAVAAEVDGRCLRARIGTDRIRNAVYGSPGVEAAERDLALVFEGGLESSAVYDNCSLVLVKPGAVKAGRVDDVLESLLGEGIEVAALAQVQLSSTDAQDLLSAYHGVCPEYGGWVDDVSSGPCVAIQVRGADIVRRVRELAGPYDPDIARELRPGTWRAQWGKDEVRNAVHVTDLPRDGPLECKFVFHVVGRM